MSSIATVPAMTVAVGAGHLGNGPGEATVSVYVPGASTSRYLPSLPERVDPARCPDASLASTSALSGLGGQGLSTRSTGHVGPADTVPCTPVTGPAGVGLCDGDGRVEAVGKTDSDGKGRPEGEVDPEADREGDPVGKGDAVDVTLGETATAAGGGVDSRQAASASRPSNAGPATPSYCIPRR